MRTPATPTPIGRSVSEQFAGLICADEQWLRTEFDAIVAAEWPEQPPLVPRRGQHAVGSRGSSAARAHGGSVGLLSNRPTPRVRTGWGRPRSPPFVR